MFDGITNIVGMCFCAKAYIADRTEENKFYAVLFEIVASAVLNCFRYMLHTRSSNDLTELPIL